MNNRLQIFVPLFPSGMSTASGLWHGTACPAIWQSGFQAMMPLNRWAACAMRATDVLLFALLMGLQDLHSGIYHILVDLWLHKSSANIPVLHFS